jgi:hypothetical protein
MASLWNLLIKDISLVDRSDVFFAHDSGTHARCHLQRDQMLPVSASQR